MSDCASETCCDLGQMTNDQLEKLRQDVTRELDTRAVEDEGKFYESDEFKALKKEFKTLKKEFKTFGKSHEMELTLPLKFKVKLHPAELSELVDDSYKVELYDVWEVEVSAKVQPSEDYDKNMQVNLQGVVDDACRDLCSEVLYLKPELGKSMDAFVEKVNDFRTRLQESPACGVDME